MPGPGRHRDARAPPAVGEAEVLTGQGRWHRHAAVGLLGAVLAAGFWASRPEWSAEMRVWRAFGDASFALLALALATGPLAVLWPPARRLLAWRRAFGIWFALVALIHAYLVWDGWARWTWNGLLGFQDLRPMGVEEPVLTDPGFGLANLLGLVALGWGLVLLATSFDRAVRRLGPRAWKHVQAHANVVFYLLALHGIYFLFLHYEFTLASLVFRKQLPAPNWFRFWFLALVLAVVALQSAAFLKVVRARRAVGAEAAAAPRAPGDAG